MAFNDIINHTIFQHLHQLQNLYFDLTGQELTISQNMDKDNYTMPPFIPEANQVQLQHGKIYNENFSKVYIIIHPNKKIILGCFSTREKAEKYIGNSVTATIMELEVN